MTRLAAGCLLPGFAGLEAPDWLRRRLSEGLGGVVLFARNVRDREQLAALTAAIRAERPEALIAVDEEGGDVTRLEADRGSSYPGNAALGVVDDVALTERVAGAIGADLRAVGVNVNFAPVADVASNPDNPVIGVRSFGGEPELVARHVAAFVSGLQSAGVAACAKHFPGHGATSEDSHLQLPTLDRELSEEVAPFRAAISAGVRAIMSAHILVPALSEVPATVSPELLTSLLREELGFEGLVVTDALEMRAISGTIGVEEGAVRALAAGADALCLGHDLGDEACERIGAAIEDAVRAGRLGEERLAEAATRVSATARWAFSTESGSEPLSVDGAVGLEAARRALRSEGRVALSRPAFVVELHGDVNIAAGPARHGLGDFLRDAEVLRVDAPRAIAIPAEREAVVVVRDAHRYPWQQELIAGLADAVVVETGVPVWRPPAAAGYLATHGAGRVNLEAAAQQLST